MDSALISPAKALYFGLPGTWLFITIPLVGISIFTYIIVRRVLPLRKAAADPRGGRTSERVAATIKYWLAQYKHPRYLLPGVMHILLFSGFLILSIRSLTLVFIGIFDGFVLPGFGGGLGHVYGVFKDIAETGVLVAAVILIIRRLGFKPARYSVPPRYGKEHTAEAVLVLCLITGLVTCDMVFEGSAAAAATNSGLTAESFVPGSGAWIAAGLLQPLSAASLQGLHLGSYLLHELIFFFFLCFLPLGKHFHVITPQRTGLTVPLSSFM